MDRLEGQLERLRERLAHHSFEGGECSDDPVSILLQSSLTSLGNLCEFVDSQRDQQRQRIHSYLIACEGVIRRTGIAFVMSSPAPACPCIGCWRDFSLSAQDQLRQIMTDLNQQEKQLHAALQEAKDRLANYICEDYYYHCEQTPLPEPIQRAMDETALRTLCPVDQLDLIGEAIAALSRIEAGFAGERQELIDKISLFWRSLGMTANENYEKLSRRQLRKILDELSTEHQERLEAVRGACHLIGRLWSLLQTPSEEQFPLDDNLVTDEWIQRLEREKKRLIDFQQERFRDLFDRQTAELKRLWSIVEPSETVRAEIEDSLARQKYTVEGLQILSKQISNLQLLAEKSSQIRTLIGEREQMIQKMKEFELSASNPNRLFGSSFRLIQEEKFRKSAYPTLLKIEATLGEHLDAYLAAFNQDFLYKGSVYRTMLAEEKESRYVNAAIFEFDASSKHYTRTSALPPPPSNVPRYTGGNTAAGKTNNNISNSSNGTLSPMRRSLSSSRG